MDDAQLLQYALCALGACIGAIGWWIAMSLTALNDKMERVLIHLESHDKRLNILEKKVQIS